MNVAEATDESAYFATCPKGLEALLARELRELGAARVQESIAGCYFFCSQPVAYRVCMWSRVANRVVQVLLRSEIDSAEALLEKSLRCDWASHFDAMQRIAIDFNGSNDVVRNAGYGAQLVKDALNDHFRASGQGRVTIDTSSPQVHLYARLFKRKFTLGIDLVGESLHRRGYRQGGGEAPLKENLAAALLMLCDWRGIAEAGGSFVDPMCGSGTLLVEAALQAGNIAPGYLRRDWALEQLHSVNGAAWDDCVREARTDPATVALPCSIFGSDSNRAVLERASENLRHAGLERAVSLQCAALQKLPNDSACFESSTGLLLSNPPYGQRIGDRTELEALYTSLGALLKKHCLGWQSALITDNPELGWSTGLRSFRQHKLFNGSIACKLLRYRVAPENMLATRPVASAKAESVGEGDAAPRRKPLNEGATMLANRLRKNRRRLKNWLRESQVCCYRVYDADLPEYACAIDCYLGQLQQRSAGHNPEREKTTSSVWGKREPQDREVPQQVYLHLQEYAAPATIAAETASRRLEEALAAACAVFEVDPGRVVIKRRERQRGRQQYQRNDAQTPDLLVEENGASLLVNLGKYLDTGLFLDHRPLRRMLGERCRGKRFLNLYAYTATATVHAARGGARSSVSVDMSKNYLTWAQRNFALNNMPLQQHRLEQADCFDWLKHCAQRFDVILLDPPSFSNSARMSQTLDIQRDHEGLIAQCMELLEPGGELYFSNNRRGFRLAGSLHGVYTIEDLSAQSHDPDFQRRRAHQCWRITRPG